MARIRRLAWVALALALPIAAAAGPAQAGSAHRQTDPVRRFSDGSVVEGASSTLVTNDGGATFTLHTWDLEPGHEITVWWVIFNRPENCTSGMLGLRCGEPDLFDPDVDASVVFGAGHVIGGSGARNYGAWIGAGDTDGALFGPGLTDPMGADIHLVVHDHGALPPQQIAEGIHNFGPCIPEECVDLQFSAHEQL